MRRLCLAVAYLGDQYYGYQRQPGVPTVEGLLINAVERAGLTEGITAPLYASASRTDRGVSAAQNIFSLLTTAETPDIDEINAHLPQDICVWAWRFANKNFHPRRDALHRTYLYVAPLHAEDPDIIRAACRTIVGEHDFSVFAKGGVPEWRSPVCVVYRCEPIFKNGVLLLYITANRFLRQMVRRLVNVILRIGRGELRLSDLHQMLQGHRVARIQSELANRLILIEVRLPFDLIIHEPAIPRVKSMFLRKMVESRASYFLMRETLFSLPFF
ncbi:tRNA pseudouridine(38-40) synthase TruA [archaeon]|nr:tRNA pseudouridine(38-40) synthase TruA [archaeon]